MRLLIAFVVLVFSAIPALAAGKTVRDTVDAEAIHKRIAEINIGGSCQWNDKDQEPPPLPVETYDLGDGYTLYIVGCTLGAYQPSTLIFIEGSDGLVPLPFADYSSEGGWGATLELGFVDFDAKTKELTNFVKFRGLGDCGASSRLRWTGYSFKLIEYRYRDCSDEPPGDPDGEIPEFPVVYEAQ